MKEDKNSADTPRTSYSTMLSIKKGLIGGALEGATNHPLLVLKIRKQNGMSFTLNPGILYQGVMQTTCSVAAIIAVRITLRDQLLKNTADAQKPTLFQTLTSGIFAGAGAAPISSIMELGLALRQSHYKEFKEGNRPAIKPDAFAVAYAKLTKQYGMTRCLTGMPCVSARDIIFCNGFITLGPFFASKLTANQYYNFNPTSALILSGITSGLITAVFAHPFDTVGAEQHKRVQHIDKKQITAKQVAKDIHKKHGWKGFYAALFWRAARICSAVVIFNKSEEVLGRKLYVKGP